MKGTLGWESRRHLFAGILRNDWRKLADSIVVRGIMVYDDPRGAEIERRAIAAAGWVSPRCPLGLQNNLQHQVYHLLQLWSFTGISKMSSILEIGGGFGAMHAAVRSQLFHGEYFVHDFPEMMEFQYRYARACGIPTPKRRFHPREFPTRPDLAIALWSMSEMPPESRKAITDAIQPRAWLIAYRDELEGLEAESWAQEMLADDRYTWSKLPFFQAGNFYLIGIEK